MTNVSRMKAFRRLFPLFFLLVAGGCGDGARIGTGCEFCPDMVEIPAGKFRMGSTPAETSSYGMPDHHSKVEWPKHEVIVSEPFLIGRYEVSRKEYAYFVDQTGYGARECLVYKDKRYQAAAGSSWENPTFKQGDNHPVVCVDWHDAMAYVHWLSTETGESYRLPSEAEWEYAARAGTTGARYWDDKNGNACAHANVADQNSQRPGFDCTDPFPETSPVDYGIPNAFGLYGMLGNVGELVADCGLPDYAQAGNGTAAVREGDCENHVGRGGSWWNDAYYLRAARRYSFSGAYTIVGFRVARQL